MHILEIALISLLIVMPIYTALSFKKNRQLMLDGMLSKTTAYQQTMLFLWIPTAILFCIVWFTPLTSADLGLTFTFSSGDLVGGLILLGLMVFGYFNLAKLSREAEARKPYEDVFEPLAWFLPITKSEWRWFIMGVSPTAGICEELIFRGYLIWLLQPHTGMAGAVLLSSLLFGLNHIYQGWSGVLKTALTGLVLAGAYWLTGSLWIPVILHTLIDIVSGTQAYLVLSRLSDERKRITSGTEIAS